MHSLSGAARPISYAPFVVLTVAVVATEAWRQGTYFDGAFDPVSIAKAVLSLAALAFAVAVARGRPRRSIGAGIPLAILGYLAVTVFGGWAAGTLSAALVTAVRVVILLVIAIVLVSRFDERSVLFGVVGSLAVVGAVAAVTGVGQLRATGRLSGGIPPLSPNEVALIACVVFLWSVTTVSRGEDRLRDLVVMGAALVVLLATGSRTALIFIVPAAVIVALFGRRIRRSRIIAVFVLLPLIAWWLVAQGGVTDLLTRDGSASASNLTSLSNRTVAWAAALAPKSSEWLTWFGGGLSMKQIPLTGQYWAVQILDNSWLSALIQGGFIGLSIMFVTVVAALAKTLRVSSPYRGFRFALVLFLAVRAILESGLFDSSTAFIAFAVAAILPTTADTMRDLTPSADDRHVGVLRAGSEENVAPLARLRWRPALCCLAAGIALAGLFDFFAPHEYESTTSLLASTTNTQLSQTDAQGDAAYQGNLEVVSLMPTYVNLATSTTVLDAAANSLGGGASAGSLNREITAANPAGTTLITITAKDSDPVRAQRIAAATAAAFSKTIMSVAPSSQVQIAAVQRAVVPTAPSGPNKALVLAIGALIGALTGLAVALWPLVRVTSSATGQLRVIMAGPLARRLRMRRARRNGTPSAASPASGAALEAAAAVSEARGR